MFSSSLFNKLPLNLKSKLSNRISINNTAKLFSKSHYGPRWMEFWNSLSEIERRFQAVTTSDPENAVVAYTQGKAWKDDLGPKYFGDALAALNQAITMTNNEKFIKLCQREIDDIYAQLKISNNSEEIKPR